MSDFEFTAYLSNRNSKDIYKDNTVQSFTNNINPPIVLDGNWEVALVSCILGFEPLPVNNFLKKRFNITLTLNTIKILENSEIKQNGITVDVDFSSHLFFHTTPEKIYKHIIEFTRLKLKKPSSFVEHFIGMHEGHIVLTLRTSKSIIKSGPFSNLSSLTINFNKNMQKILGLLDSDYTLYEADINLSGVPKILIGKKKISLHDEEPTYIMLYSDIIQPTRFGSQFINVLDIVPFGSSISIDRKLNKISYKTLNKNIINDISIIIQDPTFRIMENESQDCVLSLHFRKKKPFL